MPTSWKRILCGAGSAEGTVNGFKTEGGAKRSVSEFQKQNRLQCRLYTKRQAPLRRSRRRLNLLRLVGWARGFRVSRDPQTRGTEGSRVRAARVTKRETHAALRQLHRRLSASGCGKLRGPAVKLRGRPGEAETSCQAADHGGKPGLPCTLGK